jgi:hypothetical protein
MAAIGAFYCFEQDEGHRLYGATQLLIYSISQARRKNVIDQLTCRAPRPIIYGGASANHSSYTSSSLHTSEDPQLNAPLVEGEDPQAQLQRAQALTILMAMGTWGEKPLLQDSLAMSNQLACLVRQLGISKPDDSSNLNLGWLD